MNLFGVINKYGDVINLHDSMEGVYDDIKEMEEAHSSIELTYETVLDYLFNALQEHKDEMSEDQQIMTILEISNIVDDIKGVV